MTGIPNYGWTDEQVEAAIVEACERSGVPRWITDPATIAEIVQLSLPRPEGRKAS